MESCPGCSRFFLVSLERLNDQQSGLTTRMGKGLQGRYCRAKSNKALLQSDLLCRQWGEGR